MTLADKIVVLRAGHIEQVGSPMHLYQDPDNKFVAGFIGSPAMNFVNGVAEAGGVRVPALSDTVIPTTVALPAPGSAVTVGMRPQDMELTAAPSAIKLDIRERLGGVAYDYLTTPTGERLVVESKGDLAMEEGTEVTVSFDESRAMFFDETTEARLR
mmetsp:Transcript_23165/g.39613  ORF Transcript_23165/g.39613 Transcript_23165/m.39613 type:complete len:157 (+) Transcript_23165:2-472(+)